MSKRNKKPPLFLIIAIGLLGFGAFKFLTGLFAPKSLESPAPPSIATRISLGSRILVASQTTTTAEKQAGVQTTAAKEAEEAKEAKEAGVQAFARGDYQTASQKFQASLQKNRNDPESMIYLNNATANANHAAYLKIAVSVPIGSNPNVAQELLRGVAHAQDEVNLRGGINRRLLQVQIVSDDNDPNIVKEVAAILAKDASILAVIGHNASNASIAAAPIYQQEKLVMVSPTSFANDLSGLGSYIFRTVPNISVMAAPLAEYVVKTAGKTDIAICYDSKSTDNLSFKKEFVAAVPAAGGKLVPSVCDLSIPDFNAESAIADAVSKGAKALMLAPHIDRIDRAIYVASINRGKLPLYGSTTMYTFQTLKNGQKSVEGLILTVPWHPDTNPGSNFPIDARRRWGGIVNWRTATSYDATQAVIAGLKQSDTREGLQQALRNPNFAALGASEDVRFLPTGDRAGKPILVQVKQAGTGYKFVPLQ